MEQNSQDTGPIGYPTQRIREDASNVGCRSAKRYLVCKSIQQRSSKGIQGENENTLTTFLDVHMYRSIPQTAESILRYHPDTVLQLDESIRERVSGPLPSTTPFALSCHYCWRSSTWASCRGKPDDQTNQPHRWSHHATLLLDA